MKIDLHATLRAHNTFGFDVSADYLAYLTEVSDIPLFIQKAEEQQAQWQILGGCSNLVLAADLQGYTGLMQIKGRHLLDQTDTHVFIEAMAGEDWHEFVTWTLEQGYGGLENLALIPGTVGATPIQNIGAYGTEIKDTFVSCKAMTIESQEMKTFTKDECDFGYRESVFKNEAKNQFIITSVVFKLTKTNHKINTSYGDISSELAKNNIKNPTLKDVSNAVIAIRQSKLPDPKELGNSGSFFKNPILLKSDFEKIHQQFPEMKYFDISETEVKVPAGWLIEQAGFKGKRFGDAGIHKNQALVLVNYGNATGQEILNVSKDIQETIFKTFGIHIEAEVNVI